MIRNRSPLLSFEEVLNIFAENRMYPPGYGKEPTMTSLEYFIRSLKALAAKAPSSLVTLPPNSHNLPEGCCELKELLLYIAFRLKDKPSSPPKGNRHAENNT